MAKTLSQEEKEELFDVAHFERKAFEKEIPGFEMYTIDDEMVLRSYRQPGSPRILQPKANHHGGVEYNLWTFSDEGLRIKKSFAPLRLYLCACAGLNPKYTTLEDFEYDENGKATAINLRTRKDVKHKPGNIINSYAYRKQMSDKERQQMRAARQEMELKALQKAIATDDYGEVLKMLWSYKSLVIGVLWVKHHVKKERAEELFSIAVEHCVQRFRKGCFVVSNFMGFVVKNAEFAMYNKA